MGDSALPTAEVLGTFDTQKTLAIEPTNFAPRSSAASKKTFL